MDRYRVIKTDERVEGLTPPRRFWFRRFAQREADKLNGGLVVFVCGTSAEYRVVKEDDRWQAVAFQNRLETIL